MKDKKCSICDIECARVAKHVAEKHPEELERQNQLVLKYYRDGLSARKIATLPDIMYTGGTSVVRVLNKYLTKEELEAGRKERISTTLEKDYAEGKYDWVNAINTERNQTDEAKQKNSEGLKKAYTDGIREPLNKGLTKFNTERLKIAAEKCSETMQAKAAAGELTTLLKPGPDHPKWIDDRSQVSKYWRKNEEFQKNDRKKILARAEYKCQSCGVTAQDLAIRAADHDIKRCMLECDHIIPIRAHGTRDWETNGQALCSFCHIRKTLKEGEDSVEEVV